MASKTLFSSELPHSSFCPLSFTSYIRGLGLVAATKEGWEVPGEASVRAGSQSTQLHVSATTSWTLRGERLSGCEEKCG